jgi:hypothetical protein
MLRKNKKYVFVLLLCFSAAVVIETLAPRPIDWSPSYQRGSDLPLGSSALYQLLPGIFPGQEITPHSLPAYNVLSQNDPVHCNYIFINDVFAPDKLDTKKMLYFVSKGNHLFVAANQFGGLFADTLDIESKNVFPQFKNYFTEDSSALQTLYKLKDSATINFSNPKLKKENPFAYHKIFENFYFSKFDSSRTIILGVNNFNYVNFIKKSWGRGTIYISTVPEAFTNYHLTARNNHEYVSAALSYLPLQKVFWDEYYKAGNISKDSPLRVIFNQPALRSAYFLVIFSILVFMALGAKRKQRIIPELDPMRNTTMQFVEVVGALYFQAGDHKNIAEKKITYFLEYIRSAFNVKTATIDEAMLLKVSSLSGIELEKIRELFGFFSVISSRSSINQQELLKLNSMIEEFHKMSKR